MIIIFTLISIWALTGLAYIVRRFTPLKVCPICAGVSLTWVWMLVATLTGQLPITDYRLPIAILMGGSVVGLAYQIEKHLVSRKASWGTLLLWKTLFIPVGFAAIWGVLAQTWWLALAGVVACGVLTWAFLRRPAPLRGEEKQKVAALEKEMENCC